MLGTTKPDPTAREIGLEVAPPGFEPRLPDPERQPRAFQADNLTGNGVLLDHLAGLGQNAELTFSRVQIKPDAIHGSASLPARSQRRLPDPERYCHYQGRPATSSQLNFGDESAASQPKVPPTRLLVHGLPYHPSGGGCPELPA